MKLIDKLIGDQLRAKYGNTKFYIKQFTFLVIKTIFTFAFSMIFFLAFFFILTPQPTEVKMRPLFQVKKSSDNNMITIFTNKQAKKSFCSNQSTTYFGKLFTKQQFCQFQHDNFPFEISDHHQIDISLFGMNKNVQFITGCLVKINQDRSVCQKFAYGQNLRIFNNLKFQDLYAIEIQLQLKQRNQFYGDVNILFEQQNSFFIKLIKEYYFLVTIMGSLLFSGLLTVSFAIFQIPDILERGAQQDKKAKAQ